MGMLSSSAVTGRGLKERTPDYARSSNHGRVGASRSCVRAPQRRLRKTRPYSCRVPGMRPFGRRKALHGAFHRRDSVHSRSCERSPRYPTDLITGDVTMWFEAAPQRCMLYGAQRPRFPEPWPFDFLPQHRRLGGSRLLLHLLARGKLGHGVRDPEKYGYKYQKADHKPEKRTRRRPLHTHLLYHRAGSVVVPNSSQ
jgi:hypothetical protein